MSRKARIFFSEFNIRLYDENSESDYFFSSTKIRIFFNHRTQTFIHWISSFTWKKKKTKLWFWFWFLVFNATFNNIAAISWRPVLVVEEAVVPECTFFVNYKGRREPTRIGGDRLVWVVRSSNYLARWVTRALTLILKKK